MEFQIAASTSRKSTSKHFSARSECLKSLDDQFPTVANKDVGSRCLDRTVADDFTVLSCD
jgi:hypothetical protein